MNGYTGGRIKRIKIRHFMTYDNLEIFPKKGLNLVVGLNGSGKSSIMCAICLGLAGKPHFTGRASQLSDFIKHGHQEAEIEIELDSGSRRNLVINRKLKLDKCEWTLNGVPSSQNEVAAAVKEYNIDTSNLCQFLPQEKVVEFSRMDKKQRLENMLQAIGEPRLFELFNELKELHQDVTDKEKIIKQHQNNKNTAEEDNERISDEVQKQESRVRLKNELEDLHKQKKLAIYNEKYEEVKQMKRRIKIMKAEKELLCQEEREADSRENAIFKLYEVSEKNYKECVSRREQLLKKINDLLNSLINFKEQIENAKIECQNKIEERNKDQQRHYNVKQQIEALEKCVSEEKSNFLRYQEEEKLNEQSLYQVQKHIQEIYNDVGKTTAELNSADHTYKQKLLELTSLRDEQNKKMINLKKRDKHTYEAACWLLQNRHCFKGNVYLPIMLEINMKSAADSKYVENVIGFRDMIAFVCEDKSDCERLTDILHKQQKLRVNIVMAPDNTMSNFTAPQFSEQHRMCGLRCFVSELFTAPEPVMRYLCSCYHIHRIPVAKSVIPGSNFEFILQTFATFFTDNMRVSGKRSRYGNRNLSVRNDFIRSQNLLANTNDELQREVEQQCNDLKEKCAILKSKLDEINAVRAEEEKNQEKLRQERKSLQARKKKLEDFEHQLLSRKKLFAQYSARLCNEEDEKGKLKKTIQTITDIKDKVLSDLYGLLKKNNDTIKEIAIVGSKANIYSRNYKLTQASNEEIHDKVKEATSQIQTLEKERSTKKQFATNIYAEIEAMGEEDEETEERKKPPPQDASCDSANNAELEVVNHMSLSMDEVEQKINHIQAQLRLNEDNEPLVVEYNKRRRRIEQIQSQIETYQSTLETIKQEIGEKKREWLDPLQNHIGNINRKFSHYFKELSCVGEISLDIPEDPDDFTKYGLRINLKFHDEEASLCELSQTRHSGGECSVAAIVFILSLQELTEVPFRCIDEINQGMDSVNERKIYQLISDSVADDRCSQYFLLTPKLLLDLEYPDDVALHIIYNSSFIDLKLDVKKHLALRARAS